jgi:ubiquinone/menaquinone biosynthesis C-methylase UbiE
MPALSATLAAAQPATAPDFTAIKVRQKATWASGDYSVIGNTLQIVGETLCEAADLRAGQRVLDVAAGNGNATLAAARRWCEVTSTDYVPALLERGRERAAAERLHGIDFREADAEALPFDDGSFDAVVSTFGCMFAPNPPRVAGELLRACRPGGRIAMANWTPDGFIGQVFKAVGKHVPPPAGVTSPAQWGSRARIDELFGNSASHVAPRHASSCSAIARPATCWKCSAATTARS